jgi:hypothetical protein
MFSQCGLDTISSYSCSRSGKLLLSINIALFIRVLIVSDVLKSNFDNLQECESESSEERTFALLQLHIQNIHHYSVGMTIIQLQSHSEKKKKLCETFFVCQAPYNPCHITTAI